MELVVEADEFRIVSPVDGSLYAKRPYARGTAIEGVLARAERAFLTWRSSPMRERTQLVTALAHALSAKRAILAEAVAWQIGRPIAQADEADRFETVTRKHVEAASALAPEAFPSEPAVERHVRRGGQGVHLSIAPWNYPLGLLPWLIVAPALGGNTVILKHADQTAIVAEIVAEAIESIGAPEGIIQVIAMDHDDAGKMIGSGRLKGVNFIGSVRGGLEVHRAAAGTLTHVHLELGGKDPAYVRPDADLRSAVAEIADGSFSNSGQSCCSVERIYVHDAVYDRFVDGFRQEMLDWSIGHPITETPSIGPVVRKSAADYVRRQVADAVARGARAHSPYGTRAIMGLGDAYVAPVLLTEVDASMSIMRDELFGPVACIQRVAGDDEAVALMNDSDFGLTASVWTADTSTGVEIGNAIDAGTVFVNRCDHADLHLPWSGRKNSGLGVVNGREGLLALTSTKSFHVRAPR